MSTVQEQAPAQRRETAYERAIRRAREQFVAETGEHQMTVLLDQMDPTLGPPEKARPYRHLRFARRLPDGRSTGIWSFDIVTWPGHLAISGDLASFTFSRLHDMFGFFRSPVGRSVRINPSYWGEKVVAGARNTDLGRSRFSVDAFIEQVEERVGWASDDLLRSGGTEADVEAMKQAVHDELLADPPEYLEEARERLSEFRWSPPAPVRPEDVREAVDNYLLVFEDAWEWDLGGYDHHFLLVCHAVQYAVDTYLAAYPDRLVREVR